MMVDRASSVSVRLRVWSARHEVLVSRILITLAVIGYGLALYTLFNWRHGLMVFEACEERLFGNPSSQYCQDIKGWLGRGAALIEAIPLAAGAMLVVFGLVYWLFGDLLDLRPNHSWRRETFIDTVLWTVVVGGGTLLLLGIVPLFIL